MKGIEKRAHLPSHLCNDPVCKRSNTGLITLVSGAQLGRLNTTNKYDPIGSVHHEAMFPAISFWCSAVFRSWFTGMPRCTNISRKNIEECQAVKRWGPASCFLNRVCCMLHGARCCGSQLNVNTVLRSSIMFNPHDIHIKYVELLGCSLTVSSRSAGLPAVGLFFAWRKRPLLRRLV